MSQGQHLRLAERLTKALGHATRPGRLLHKLRRVWWRRRSEREYRRIVERGGLVTEVGGPAPRGLITVATPVYRVAEEHLRATIASVRAQTHRDWELLLLDDASPDAHVQAVLSEAAREDQRIRVGRRATTGGISTASNELVATARGAFVAFLDHDDTLHPRALETVGRLLAARPETDWVFSDEDKIDTRGRHSEPCLKPGWSPSLLLSFNYVAHLRVVRRTLIDRLGGHRPAFDGAQDWDLALRALAAGARFAHLPGVLYHWRAVPSSMAALAQAKPLAHERARRALLEYAGGWPRGGVPEASVLLEPASLFRVRRAVPPGLDVETLPERQVGWGDVDALLAAVRESSSDIVEVPPPGGFSAVHRDALLALLLQPTTVIAAARGVRRRRVATSGWVVTEDGACCDPWAGLAVADPGYLNLALVPGARALPPARGWVGWRDRILVAWDAAADVAPQWRLAAGIARLGNEVVVTPEVSYASTSPAGAPAVPPPAVAATVPRTALKWPVLLGLTRCSQGGSTP